MRKRQSNLFDDKSVTTQYIMNKTSLTPPLFITVPVPNQARDRSCICMLQLSILSLFLRFFYYILDF